VRRLISLSPILAALLLAGCADAGPGLLAPGGPSPAAEASAARKPAAPASPQLIAKLPSGQGSAVGPGGALYVTDPASGTIVRIDPRTGATATVVAGLPRTIPAVGIGGAFDVAFIGQTAYVLVTLVGPDVGGTTTSGIYRVDGSGRLTLVADIGAFSIANPPRTAFFVPSGVQYALEPFRGGFLVTDGHHNRVLQLSLDGTIRELITFGNLVPTGLAVSGNTIYLAQAGPIPHLPQDGKVVTFGPTAAGATTIASGASLLVDVELGRGRTLFALSQGPGVPGAPDGSPAQPNTGALLRVNDDGTLTVLAAGIDRPTALEIIGNTAYVVTLTGEVWRIDDLAAPPYGSAR
jgi:hypothetical protein